MKAKLIYLELYEKRIGVFKGEWCNGEVEVYKNPQTLKYIQPWIRACSDKNGNFYIADSQDILHHEIAKFLIKNKIGTDFIDWQRYKDTNIFYIAEGYDLNNVGLKDAVENDEWDKIQSFGDILVDTYPKFKFIYNKTILDS